MPEPIDDKKGAGNDPAAAANAAPADGAANNDKNVTDGEEMVTIKKSDLKRIEEDRDNYRQMGLSRKADERNLNKKSDSGNDGNKNQVVIDEKKISETAVSAANEALKKAGEKTAKRLFLKNNPEYADDAQWNALMDNLTFKGNEITAEDILDRMEAALLEHKRSTGKLNEYIQRKSEQERTQGRIEGMMDTGRSSGGAGDRNQGGGQATLSPRAEFFARAMHADPEKVRKVNLKENGSREIANP